MWWGAGAEIAGTTRLSDFATRTTFPQNTNLNLQLLLSLLFHQPIYRQRTSFTTASTTSPINCLYLSNTYCLVSFHPSTISATASLSQYQAPWILSHLTKSKTIPTKESPLNVICARKTIVSPLDLNGDFGIKGGHWRSCRAQHDHHLRLLISRSHDSSGTLPSFVGVCICPCPDSVFRLHSISPSLQHKGEGRPITRLDCKLRSSRQRWFLYFGQCLLGYKPISFFD